MRNKLNITVINDEISDSLSETIEFLKTYGMKYVELRTIQKKNLIDYSLEEVKNIRETLLENGISVSAFASPLFKWYPGSGAGRSQEKVDTFGFNPRLDLSTKRAYISKAIEVAKALGTHNIRLFSGLKIPSLKYSFISDPLLGFALEEARKAGVRFLLENEPPCYIHQMDDIKNIAQKFSSQNLGIWFDVANFYRIGEGVLLEDLKLLKSNIGYFHLKDFDREGNYVALGEGVINYKRIISDIKEVFGDKEIFLSVETHSNVSRKSVTVQSLTNLKKYMVRKRVSYAIVGCGNIARRHALAIKASKEGELRYCYDVDRRRGREFAREYDAKNVSNFSDLLGGDVDIVCVCTPHNTHAGYVLRVLGASKYCLCEKPLCLYSSEINEIMKAQNFKTHLFVSFQKRYNKAVTKLLELVKSGKLGKIQLVSATLRWSRTDDYFMGRWQGKKRKSGGLLFNQGAHLLDLMAIIGGRPKRLTGFNKKKLRPKVSEIDDIYSGTFEFDRGALGVVEATTALHNHNHQESIFVLGTKGHAEVTGSSLNKPYLPLPTIGANDQENTNSDYGDGHYELIERVNRFISYGENDPLLPRGEDGVLATHLIRFMYGHKERVGL